MTLDSSVTQRRIKVAELIRQGATYQQMVDELGVSESTITRDVQALKSFDSIRAFDDEIQEMQTIINRHLYLLQESIKVFSWVASDEDIDAAVASLPSGSTRQYDVLGKEAENRLLRRRRLIDPMERVVR